MSKLILASIELSKLKSAPFTTKQGTKCIMIPVDQQGINVTESGRVYLNFNIWENDKPDTYGNTHGFVHQKTKEKIAAKEKDVYIGNGKFFVKKEDSKQVSNEPENLSNPNFDENSLPF